MHLCVNPSSLSGKVLIPASKSHTVRAVAIASLADGISIIKNPLRSADTLSAVEVYCGLGAEIETGENWIVRGVGGEFVIILPGSTASGAVDAAERIRSQFEQMKFYPKPGEPVRLTLSIGVAEHLPGEDPSDLVRRADKALYKAKALGKNRIVISGRDGLFEQEPYPSETALSGDNRI